MLPSLKSALQSGDVDIVLTNLGDDRPRLRSRQARARRRVLSVIYKPTTNALSGSSMGVTCTTRADKARGRQMLEAIENVLAHKGSGLASNCAPASDSKST